jgi:hypothetical protein
MSQYKISKERLAEIIKEEYAAILEERVRMRQEQQTEQTNDHLPTTADGSMDAIRQLIQQELKTL